MKNLIIGQALYIYKRYNYNKYNNDANSIYSIFYFYAINKYKYYIQII